MTSAPKRFFRSLRSPETTTSILFLGYFFAFFFSLYYGAVTTAPRFDDGFNASVSRNLSLGIGYARYYPRPLAFPPEVSTGPTLLVPVAAATAVFGNQYWVPGVVVVSVILILLVGLKYSLRTLGLQRQSSGFVLIVGTFLSYNFYLVKESWFTLLGEVPAALLLILATALLSASVFRPKSDRLILLSGLLIGLAQLSKTISLLSVLPILFGVFWIAAPVIRIRATCQCALVCSLGIFLPNVCWRTFQLYTVDSFEGLRRIYTNEAEFFRGGGSGLNQLESISSWRAHFASKLDTYPRLIEEFCPALGLWGMLLATFTTIIVSILMVPRIRSIPQLAFTSALLFSFIAHLGWWVLIAPNPNVRWVQIGVVTGCFLLAFLCLLAVQNARKSLLAALSVLLCFEISNSVRQVFDDVYLGDVQHVVALVDSLGSRPEIQFVGVGFWVNREIEYLAANPDPYIDVTTSGADIKSNKELVVTRLVKWTSLYPKLYGYCDRNILLKNVNYVVSNCGTYEQLQRAGVISADGYAS